MPSRRALLALGALVVAVAGCGACVLGDRPPDWGAASRELRRGSLSHGGRERRFLYWAPEGAGPFPLVLALHGRYGTGANMDRMSGLSRVASREGFAVVFPDGVDKSWNDARGAGPAAEANVDDTGFLVAVADLFIAEHHADPHRVYAAGMSNGAMMALTLACRRADRFAGVAAVTGLLARGEDCRPSAPISVGLMLGDRDPLVPYEGGEVARDRGEVLSARDTAALFATANGCPAPSRAVLPDADPRDGTTTSVERWAGCAAGSEVAAWTVHGGGHTWPGGWQYLAARLVGKTSRDWSASDELWAFLHDKRR